MTAKPLAQLPGHEIKMPAECRFAAAHTLPLYDFPFLIDKAEMAVAVA